MPPNRQRTTDDGQLTTTLRAHGAPGERQTVRYWLIFRRYDDTAAISSRYPSSRWFCSGSFFYREIRASRRGCPKNAEFCMDFVEFLAGPCFPIYQAARIGPRMPRNVPHDTSIA